MRASFGGRMFQIRRLHAAAAQRARVSARARAWLALEEAWGSEMVGVSDVRIRLRSTRGAQRGDRLRGGGGTGSQRGSPGAKFDERRRKRQSALRGVRICLSCHPRPSAVVGVSGLTGGPEKR